MELLVWMFDTHHVGVGTYVPGCVQEVITIYGNLLSMRQAIELCHNSLHDYLHMTW